MSRRFFASAIEVGRTEEGAERDERAAQIEGVEHGHGPVILLHVEKEGDARRELQGETEGARPSTRPWRTLTQTMAAPFERPGRRK